MNTKELTPMEEFIHQSERVKQAMLEELLRERNRMNEDIDELQGMLEFERSRRQDAENKLAIANSVIERLTRNTQEI